MGSELGALPWSGGPSRKVSCWPPPFSGLWSAVGSGGRHARSPAHIGTRFWGPHLPFGCSLGHPCFPVSLATGAPRSLEQSPPQSCPPTPLSPPRGAQGQAPGPKISASLSRPGSRSSAFGLGQVCAADVTQCRERAAADNRALHPHGAGGQMSGIKVCTGPRALRGRGDDPSWSLPDSGSFCCPLAAGPAFPRASCLCGSASPPLRRRTLSPHLGPTRNQECFISRPLTKYIRKDAIPK